MEPTMHPPLIPENWTAAQPGAVFDLLCALNDRLLDRYGAEILEQQRLSSVRQHRPDCDDPPEPCLFDEQMPF
jgi:hypothetical protein